MARKTVNYYTITVQSTDYLDDNDLENLKDVVTEFFDNTTHIDAELTDTDTL